MAIKKFRPTTPSRRNMTMADFAEITTDKPLKSLLVSTKRSGGRNNQGKITVRHRGGGEGKSHIGHASPMTPWGKPALGYKTRKTKKYSDKFIVKGKNKK